MDGILSGMGLFGDKKDPQKNQTTTRSTPTPTLDISKSTLNSTPAAIEERTPSMKTQTSPANYPNSHSDNDIELTIDLTPSAVIGSKINFKGELSGDEDLLIQGKVEGTVTLNGYKLTIGKLGHVKANLQAKNIIIDGTVEGDIIAQEHIAINASSIVRGNITANRVTLEDGAKFRGSIDMDTEAQPQAPSKSVAPFATTAVKHEEKPAG